MVDELVNLGPLAVFVFLLLVDVVVSVRVHSKLKVFFGDATVL